MSRKFSGPAQNIPVLAAAPVGDVGLHLDSFGLADGQFKVDSFAVDAAMSGAGTAALTVYVQDLAGNWRIAGDVGTLGVLGGGPLNTPGAYVFGVAGLGPFVAVCLVKTLTGTAAVDSATLAPVYEY